MTTYELLKADTNGTTDYLLTRDGVVISRWAELERPVSNKEYSGLDLWDDQVAAGADLSDYQADLDAGRYTVTVIDRDILWG